MLLGEYWCWSVLGPKGLIRTERENSRVIVFTKDLSFTQFIYLFIYCMFYFMNLYGEYSVSRILRID